MSVTFQQELPIYKEVDVLVAGAGPAGVGAAVAAARNGADTLVIEANGCVGGMATMGGVGPFMTSYDANHENMIIRGVFEELVERMVAMGGAIHPGEVHNEEPHSSFYRLGHNNVGPFDQEAFKLAASRMIREAGAALLLHTQFIAVLKEGDRIGGVVIANKAGLGVVRAKVVVDCTGDADVAARAGCPYVVGSEEDGNIQPASLFLRLYNVDTPRVAEHMAQHREEIRPFYGPYSWLIRERPQAWGDIPRAEVGVFADVQEGEYRLNVTRVLDVDGTKAEDLTRAELEGLEQAHKVFRFMRENAVGFENARMIGTAATIGIRETRHIRGEYRLTGEEVAACRVPEGTIAVMATNMDTHNRDNPGGSFIVPTAGPYFGVPYLCLVPKGADNLLVAGRAISADALAGSAVRMMPSCMAFGQAAGVAAAMAAAADIPPRDVDVAALRRKLTDQGAFVGD